MKCLHILPGYFPSYSQVIKVLFLLENVIDLANEHRFAFLASKDKVILSAQHALALRNSFFMDFDDLTNDNLGQLDQEIKNADRVVVYTYCEKTRALLGRLADGIDGAGKVDLICMPGEFARYVNFDLELSEIHPAFSGLRSVVVTGFLEKSISSSLNSSVFLPRLYSEDSPVYHVEDVDRFISDRLNIQVGHAVSDRSHLDTIREHHEWFSSIDAHLFLALNYGWYYKKTTKAESRYIWQTKNAVEDMDLSIAVLNRKCENSTYLHYLNSLSGLILDVDYPAAEEAVLFCVARSIPVLFKRDSMWAWYFDRRSNNLLHIEDLNKNLSRDLFSASVIDGRFRDAAVPKPYSEVISQWISFLRF